MTCRQDWIDIREFLRRQLSLGCHHHSLLMMAVVTTVAEQHGVPNLYFATFLPNVAEIVTAGAKAGLPPTSKRSPRCLSEGMDEVTADNSTKRQCVEPQAHNAPCGREASYIAYKRATTLMLLVQTGRAAMMGGSGSGRRAAVGGAIATSEMPRTQKTQHAVTLPCHEPCLPPSPFLSDSGAVPGLESPRQEVRGRDKSERRDDNSVIQGTSPCMPGHCYLESRDMNYPTQDRLSLCRGIGIGKPPTHWSIRDREEVLSARWTNYSTFRSQSSWGGGG